MPLWALTLSLSSVRVAKLRLLAAFGVGRANDYTSECLGMMGVGNKC